MTRKFYNFQDRDTEIPTAALPDIVFMLLFFFMVATTFKEDNDKLKYAIPKAREVKKIEKKSIVSTISIGKLAQGDDEREVIWANGRELKINEINSFVYEERAKMPDYLKDQQIILLKIDENTKMGLVTDVQQELRKSNARKILYSSVKKNNGIEIF